MRTLATCLLFHPLRANTCNLSALFTDTLALGLDEEGDRNAALALARPDDFVLKPQREGGGNNLWGSALTGRLEAGAPARAQYTLMRRLTPPLTRNRLVQRGRASALLDTVSELGVFSVLLRARDGALLRNKPAGNLLRTKMCREREAGIRAEIAVVDSPLFI